MIKLIHLITDLDIGGAERMLCNLLTNMDRNRYVNIVISMTDLGELGPDVEKMGVRVYTLGMKKRSSKSSSF